MTGKEYKDKAIELFKSGKATEEQWQELGEALLYVSESCGEKIEAIDNTIDPIPTGMCSTCYYDNPEDAVICENCKGEL